MKKSFLLSIIILFALFARAQEKYAVLICGDKPVEEITYATATSGWGDPGDEIKNEFWNDTFLMWEMLVYEKGYYKENVYVLYYDGVDYNDPLLADRYNAEVIHYGDHPVTDYIANKTNLEMVFDGLATGTNGFPLVTEDDFLFVWTFGHGGPGGDPELGNALLLYGGEILDTEFAAYTNAINANKKVFWMQQENANNFAKTIRGKTIVFDPNPLAGKLPQEKNQAWNSLLKDVL